MNIITGIKFYQHIYQQFKYKESLKYPKKSYSSNHYNKVIHN